MLKTRGAARPVWMLAMAITLAACGGGGGAPQPAGPAVSLGNVRLAATDQEVFEGDDPIQPVEVRADVTGDLASLNGQTVYVIVEDPDQLFATNPSVAVTPDGRDSLLSIPGRWPNARVGDFTGPLRVNVCLDARCERHFGNSPVQVPYRIKVLPGLKLLGAPPTIALGGAFGAAAPSWAGDIQVPAGAAQPSLSLEWGNSSGPFWGPQFASNLFDLRTAGSRLTVVGQPAPVGELLAFLRLQTTATTSKGRTVALGQDYTLQYTVTGAPELQVLYGPGALQFALPAGSTANTPVQRVTSLVNTGFRIDTFTRVEYLPPGPSGNADAAGFSWLRAGNWGSLLQGYEVGADLYARACPDSVDLVGPPVCLPPGRYEARVYPKRVVTADEIALPLSVTLTVGP